MWLLLLAACAGPAAAPSLPGLRASLDTIGVDAAEDGEALRFEHAGPGGRYAVRVSTTVEPPAVVLRTDGLWSLTRQEGDAAAVVLVLQVATLNHELHSGRLALDGATGAVELTLELPAEDGVGAKTLEAGVQRLLRDADAILPRLAAAR
ncbi:MAG TPA: hypothetical protein PKA64_25310 [Myxococcota bacterium]|nr:hypothetical protein [Myxococcota bacterium]